MGTIEKGAMPWLNRHVGNPFLSGMLNLMFSSKVSDVHCGMRAVTKDAFRRMNVSSSGMEFASEMVVKAALADMRIIDVPITLRPDGRTNHGPHLRPLRDGWRHLRFMLLLSPTYLFLLPAAICMTLGIGSLAILAFGPVRIGPMNFDYHYMILGSLLFILGFQLLVTGLCAKTVSHAVHISTADPLIDQLKRSFTLERGIVAGALLFVAGFGVDLWVLIGWLDRGMGQLNAIRPATLASTLMIVGAQTMFSSFFLSMLLQMPKEESRN
jgi:hypothetical protein